MKTWRLAVGGSGVWQCLAACSNPELIGRRRGGRSRFPGVPAETSRRRMGAESPIATRCSERLGKRPELGRYRGIQQLPARAPDGHAWARLASGHRPRERGCVAHGQTAGTREALEDFLIKRRRAPGEKARVLLQRSLRHPPRQNPNRKVAQKQRKRLTAWLRYRRLTTKLGAFSQRQGPDGEGCS